MGPNIKKISLFAEYLNISITSAYFQKSPKAEIKIKLVLALPEFVSTKMPFSAGLLLNFLMQPILAQYLGKQLSIG